jgi:HK97 family phage major capsid protein
MLQSHLHELRKAERRAHEQIQAAARKAQNHSLIELIRSRVPSYNGPYDTTAAYAVFDLNSEIERIVGPANGCWVPISIMQRDLGVSNASAIAASGMQSSIAPALAPVSTVVAAGATVLAVTQSGALKFPTISQPANASSAWTSEGQTYATTEPVFGQVVVLPVTIGVQIKMSRMLIVSATPDVERAVRAHLMECLMRELDRVAIAGSGTGDQPAGLLNNPDVPVVVGGPNGAAPTWANIVALEHQVAASNGDITAGAFLMSPNVLRALRTTTRGANLGYIMENDSRPLGHPVCVSSHVPNTLTKGSGTNLSAIIFGNWSDLLIAVWNAGAVDLLVDGVTQIKNGWIVISARLECGIAALRPAAFAKMTDIQTT